VSAGKLRANSDDMITSRDSCLAKSKDGCGMCPNSEFNVRFVIVQDTGWLDDIVDQVCTAIDARMTKVVRRVGDCCPQHPEQCLFIDYHIRLGKNSTFDKNTAKTINDLIEASPECKGKVLHVNVRRQEASFDMTVVLPKG
jgi:hypothetical protein